MKKKLFAFLLLAVYPCYRSYGSEEIIVPKSIYFGNNRVYFSKNIRKKIQIRANSIRKWKFKEKVNKANLLFPIIEPIMKQNNIPNDIKYVAMHESGLQIDCISHTQDYGIWALNACSIEECNLKVNDEIDERMHVIYSTEAMCRKMANNHKNFKNWIDTILAYNIGLTGTINFKKKYGLKYIKIKKNRIYLKNHTPDYIIHVIANKLAFEKKIGRHSHPTLKLHVHEVKKNKNIKKLLKHYNIPSALFFEYNKWSKTKSLPNGYKVLLPLRHNKKFNHITKIKKLSHKNKKIKEIKTPDIIIKKLNKEIYIINGLKGTIYEGNKTLNQLCKIGNISKELFLSFNDIKVTHKFQKGIYYYFEYKGTKAFNKYYCSQKGDTWWSISQKFGILMQCLLLYNNRSYTLPSDMHLKPGRVLFLRHIRPKRIPIEYRREKTL